MSDKENTKEKKPKGSSFRKDIVVDFEGGGEIHLRKPNVKELNEFDKEAYPRGKKGFKVATTNMNGARVSLFDKIFLKIVKFSDDEGDIPEDGVNRIPEDDKSYIVMHYVQAKENIDVKN